MTYAKTAPKQLSAVDAVFIGASAGGVEALMTVFEQLPSPTLSPFSITVVLHLPPDRPSMLPKLFSGCGGWIAKEAESCEKLKSGVIYLATPNYHLNVETDGSFSLSNDEPVHFSRPSIDLLFQTAARAFGPRALGVLLTGANEDGARGLQAIHEQGGLTVVQDPESAKVATMPASALKYFTPSYVLGLSEIGKLLQSLSAQKKERA